MFQCWSNVLRAVWTVLCILFLLMLKTDNMKDRMSQNLRAYGLSKDKSKTLDEQISRDKKQMKIKMQNITRLQVRVLTGHHT